MNVDQMIDELIKREGGFVDHPADRGGPTKYGITQKTLDAARVHDVVGSLYPSDIRKLTKRYAHGIYKTEYYYEPRIYELPEPWQPLVFDWAVHSGPATAIKELQKLLNGHLFTEDIVIDGVIGPQTIAAAKHVLTSPLMAYLDERRSFCASICEARPDQKVFLKGWMNRIDELEKSLA